MKRLFSPHRDGVADQIKHFDDDLAHWDVSSVTTLEGTFYGATDFVANIGGWDVSGVTIMSYTFTGATAFNANIGMRLCACVRGGCVCVCVRLCVCVRALARTCARICVRVCGVSRQDFRRIF